MDRKSLEKLTSWELKELQNLVFNSSAVRLYNKVRFAAKSGASSTAARMAKTGHVSLVSGFFGEQKSRLKASALRKMYIDHEETREFIDIHFRRLVSTS